MAKFNVILTETVTYEIDLEAEDDLDATEAAVEFWCNCDAEAQQKNFNIQGHGVEADTREVL